MKRRFAVAARLAVMASLTGNASASNLFGVDFDKSTPLFSVDQSSASFTSLGPTGFANVADLTSDPLTGRLWGVEVNTNQLLAITTFAFSPRVTAAAGSRYSRRNLASGGANARVVDRLGRGPGHRLGGRGWPARAAQEG